MTAHEDPAAAGPILIVDDDAGIRDLVSTTLERLGYRTRTAANFEEAVAHAQEKLPGVAVIDVELPGQSGYDLFRKLRNDFGDDVPVIFVSGVRTNAQDRIAGLLAGGDDFLTKPFDPEELAARIRAVLRARAPTELTRPQSP
jgi:DNA-binding response OmpR family regulator